MSDLLERAKRYVDTHRKASSHVQLLELDSDISKFDLARDYVEKCERLETLQRSNAILVETWDYTCGDGCCYEEGTKIYVNGVEVDAPWSIDVAAGALEAFVAALGVEATVAYKHESLDARIDECEVVD